jgi:hypothetical protein
MDVPGDELRQAHRAAIARATPKLIRAACAHEHRAFTRRGVVFEEVEYCNEGDYDVHKIYETHHFVVLWGCAPLAPLE